jgi:hypothetical protein
MLKRELSVLGVKRMEKGIPFGSRNRRKLESEYISLYKNIYATLQEPEFRCLTLNS